MFIPTLQRNVCICNVAQVEPLLLKTPKKWNVISICNPDHNPLQLDNAKSAFMLNLGDDTAENLAQLKKLFAYYDQCQGDFLIHCSSGLSRSPAVFVILHLRAMAKKDYQLVVKTMQALRPVAKPDMFYIELGLQALGLYGDKAKLRALLA
jgi:predicted protein tyrosine phosphatase